jgi:four helix bundle protein
LIKVKDILLFNLLYTSISYKELEIYQLSKSLAIQIHKLTLSLPKFEMYEEGSQIRRSSKAITDLIVEGFGRRKNKNEFCKYLIYTLSECLETQSHLDFLYETESFKDRETYHNFTVEYEKLGKMLNKFLQAVEKTHIS